MRRTLKPLPLFPVEPDQDLDLSKLRQVRANGSPWFAVPDNPATVPVPLPVILADVVGDYTERDRKLFRFLLHAAFDGLERGQQIHTVPIRDVARVFQSAGGDKNSNWIMESARRLARTRVEYRINCGDPRFDVAKEEAGEGFAVFLSAAKKTDMGTLVYEIPRMLVDIILKPYRFARLRTHFVIGLSGKHAVSIYEILEAFANKDDPQFTVSLPEFRQWLKLPPDKYPVWKDFNKWVIQPALKQINDEPEAAGFSVEMIPIRLGREFGALHFRLEKSDMRVKFDEIQQKTADEVRRLKALTDTPTISSETMSIVGKLYPSADAFQIRYEWAEFWKQRGRKELRNPNKAFLKFADRWAALRKIPSTLSR